MWERKRVRRKVENIERKAGVETGLVQRKKTERTENMMKKEKGHTG